jgi:hypothetical protein
MTDKETFEKWLEHHLDWHGSATLRSAWNHQQKKIDSLKARLAKRNAEITYLRQKLTGETE